MKKILIAILCLLLIGCNKNIKEEIKEKQDDTKYLSKIQLNEILFNYAIEIYDTKKYENFTKKDKEYFISLKELNEMKYDTSMFISPNSHKECDVENSGIIIDTENTKKVDYKKYPIMIKLFCD